MTRYIHLCLFVIEISIVTLNTLAVALSLLYRSKMELYANLPDSIPNLPSFGPEVKQGFIIWFLIVKMLLRMCPLALCQTGRVGAKTTRTSAMLFQKLQRCFDKFSIISYILIHVSGNMHSSCGRQWGQSRDSRGKITSKIAKKCAVLTWSKFLILYWRMQEACMKTSVRRKRRSTRVAAVKVWLRWNHNIIKA